MASYEPAHESGTSTDGVVVLVRHGRTELNAAGVLRGRLDPALDDVGRAEVAALGRAVAEVLDDRPPVVIRTSPLRRAVETARAIATVLPAPVVPDDGLADRDYGPWAGAVLADVAARFGSIDAADGVEPADLVLSRARAVLDAQIPVLGRGPVVLVGHDAVNRALLLSISGIDPRTEIGQRTACWNLIRRAGGRWYVDRIDEKPEPGRPVTSVAGERT